MPEQPQDAPQPGSQQHQIPTELTINAGTVGLVTSLSRIVAGMSTDKALTLFVAAAFGWLLFSTLQQTSSDKAQTARMYEDSRERDRRHCDDREDKAAREAVQEAAAMRAWFAAQAETARRFENEQREKDRATIAELSKIIGRKFPGGVPPE